MLGIPILPVMTGGPVAARPSPHGSGAYNHAALAALWIKHGGDPKVANVAAAIALAESSGNARARNSIGATGLWQIYNGPGTSTSLFNPDANAAAAVAKYKAAGNRFTPWTTYTGADTPGHKKTYLDFLAKPGDDMPLSAIPGVDNLYGGATSAGSQIHDVGAFLSKISDAIFSPDWWLRVGLIIGGVLMLIFGLYFIGREFVSNQLAGVVKSAVK